MTRLPKSNGSDVRKGAWGTEEDEKLRKYVETYGTGHWRSVGKKAGLQRCGKSCRLRWTNYLRPDIRHGSFTIEEEDLIIKLHASHGSRWSLIAAQLPGRTDNDIKNHWNTRLKKKLCDMGIDPVTHQPIADLLRDLAGTMARSGSAVNQVAEEAARRCFRDNMLNKAVRECGRPPAVPPFFLTQSNRNIEQRSVAEFHRYDDPIAAARRFETSANHANSAHSMDEYSSSTEESLSGHSSSPPLYMGLTHSANIQHRNPYGSKIPESSAAGHGQDQEDAAAAAAAISISREEVIYLPPPPSLRVPDGIATSSGFIQELATCPTHSTLQIFSPDSNAFRRSPDCSEALRGMIASTSASTHQTRREGQQFGAPANSQPQARWYRNSRPDSISHDQTQFQSEVDRFSTAQNNLMQQEPPQIHAGEAVSYLQGRSSGITSLATFSGTDKIDHDGHLNNLPPIQAAGIQENMGFRSLNINIEGLPSLSNPSNIVGQAGPYHDILQVNNVSDASGQFSNSANLTTSSNMITAFAPNSGSSAGTPRGTPTALRLHEYAVIPRVALWDY